MVNNENTQDDEGNSYYVVDTTRNRIVLGPYGSPEYARTCKERATYPWTDDLEVGKSEAGEIGTITSSQSDSERRESDEADDRMKTIDLEGRQEASA